MKLNSFLFHERETLGVVLGDFVVNTRLLNAHYPEIPVTMLELINRGQAAKDQLQLRINRLKEGEFVQVSHKLSEIQLLAPIPKPRKNIFGIGLNYTEHVAESARTLDTSNELPQQPVIFSKPPTTVTAHQTEVLLNRKITNQLDWEVELAVVIGTGGKNIPKETAHNHIFGYTIINDISARDCRRAGQWIVSKGQDTFAPMGPALLTADEISDPQDLDLRLTVNGIEKQNSNTKFMLFSIADLISDLSTVFALEPGDIIATGTPAGVGAGRNPQEWLKDGDLIEASVERLGTLVNHVKEI